MNQLFNEPFSENILALINQYAPRLLGALITLIIGLWVIKLIGKMFKKALHNSKLDDSLIPFLHGLGTTLLKVLLVVSVLSMLGIEMTSFIAILGAVGLAVGMALSGTLQNFAGGVIILIIKPFKKGDFISAQGYDGTVNEIQIFNTILKTPDNKTIVIPNGKLSNSSLINFSTEPKRRLDITIGIGYGDDVSKAKTIIKGLYDADERIHKDPEVVIALAELADSSVNIVIKAWVNASDFWPTKYDMNERLYNTFNAEGLNIPFPQMDVHLHQS